MFRNEMSQLSLFSGGKTVGPRPSFQPALEALEERVVPSGGLSPSAIRSMHVLEGGMELQNTAAQALLNRINNATAHGSPTEAEKAHFTSEQTDIERRWGKTRQGESLWEQKNNTVDEVFQQLDETARQLDQQIKTALGQMPPC